PVNVLGVGISPINMEQALTQLDAWIAHRDREYVCICNVHSVMECRRSEATRHVFNAAGMVTPDGMPLVWLLRMAGQRHVSRVYGPDLMLAVMERSPKAGYRHFFYGGGEGVADQLRDRLIRRFPGTRIVGTLTPAFGSVDALATPETAAAINATGADIVWVGVSSPKQDLWMSRMRPALEAPVLIGVGAAFDFHAGRIRQAPGWMQRAGLEWLFRLLHEPRRLWRRYLVDNPWFVLEVAAQRLGLRRYELP
ncbi:MAG: WecB/TagA/CpsF family glycosyltransferase, partial [Candidatus Dormibacteraeota bacterium]|nr:WecB/TagA/CpsF family glycosyltransferase [Candidatus Dormibacteraeota bacterium]